jgi:hypothetical protein
MVAQPTIEGKLTKLFSSVHGGDSSHALPPQAKMVYPRISRLGNF